MKTILLLLALASSLSAFGCASSSSSLRPRPLPFSVAIIPITSQVSPHSTSTGPSLELRLSVDPDEASRMLADTLSERSFSRVVLLPYPHGESRDSFLDKSKAIRSLHWEQSADEMGCDLILENSMTYSPSVETEKNDRFWLSLPLFLLGGPLTYFIEDRTYRCSAKLEVRVHDVRSIRDERATLEDRRAEIVFLSCEHGETDLNFLDRSSHLGNYLLSILVPVAFLARDNPKIESRLNREMIRTLARTTAQAIEKESRSILLADSISGFFLEPRTARAYRQNPQSIRILAELVLPSNHRIDHLDRYEIYAGPSKVTRDFDLPSPPPPRLGTNGSSSRYAIDEIIDGSGELDSVRLVVWDSDGNPRTFTFTIEEESE